MQNCTELNKNENEIHLASEEIVEEKSGRRFQPTILTTAHLKLPFDSDDRRQ